VEGELHTFLILALNGGMPSASCSGHITLKERASSTLSIAGSNSLGSYKNMNCFFMYLHACCIKQHPGTISKRLRPFTASISVLYSSRTNLNATICLAQEPENNH
jgi:hypothetical protein